MEEIRDHQVKLFKQKASQSVWPRYYSSDLTKELLEDSSVGADGSLLTETAFNKFFHETRN